MRSALAGLRSTAHSCQAPLTTNMKLVAACARPDREIYEL